MMIVSHSRMRDNGNGPDRVIENILTIQQTVIQEPDEDPGSSRRQQRSRSRERDLPMRSQQPWKHKIAWVTVQGRHKQESP